MISLERFVHAIAPYPAQRIAELLGGRAVLGVQVRHEMDFHSAIQKGFHSRALLRFCAQTGLSVDILGSLLGFRASTIEEYRRASRRGAGRGRKPPARLEAWQSDRLYRFARLVSRAEGSFPDLSQASAWLTHPVQGLGGAVPIELVVTEVGSREVGNELLRIEYRLFG